MHAQEKKYCTHRRRNIARTKEMLHNKHLAWVICEPRVCVCVCVCGRVEDVQLEIKKTYMRTKYIETKAFKQTSQQWWGSGSDDNCFGRMSGVANNVANNYTLNCVSKKSRICQLESSSPIKM